MILLRRRNLHAFAYVPHDVLRGGAMGSRRRAIGLTVRARARTRWRYVTLIAYWPRRDLRSGRGVVAIEAMTWLVDKDGNRLTLKAYVRLKIGLGGRKPDPEPADPGIE